MNFNTDFKIIVCAAIQNKNNKIFIARRKSDKKLGGYWEFPGGKLEHGEELEPALKRELKEELGIDVTIKKLLHIKPHVYDHGAVLILFYLCETKFQEFKLIDHDDYKWCTPKELQDLKLLPANKEVIALLENSAPS